MGRSIVLFHPPGWDACASGPYAAGPYLKGYLGAHGVHCRWVDLNLDITNSLVPRISTDEALAADAAGLAAMDSLYFGREAKLAPLAKSGRWTLREAFQPDGLDFGASASIREHILDVPPYASHLERRITELVAQEHPSFIGVTITIPEQIYGAFQVARTARRLHPDLPIIAGGNIVTRLVQEMSVSWVFDFFDALIIGPGEETLLALAKSEGRRDDWRRIPNLRYAEGSEIVATDARALTRAHFCQPDYSDVDFGSYWGFPYATIMGARGCYYGKCPFCAIPYTWGRDGYLGNDDPAKVADTMLACANKLGVSRFKFVEESMHPRVVERLSRLLSAANAEVEWEGYVRMDAPWFDPKLLALASGAGLRKVYAGLELLDSEGRKLLDKHDLPDASDFLRRMRDAGILVHLFVLAGHPGTGLDQAMRTLDFAFENKELIDTLEISGFRYEKHTTIPGVTRKPDPTRDWAMDDAFESTLEPTFSRDAIDLLEEALHRQYGLAVPTWTHPIHYMTSPWSRSALPSNLAEETVA